MLLEYKKKIFNAKKSENKISIWRYRYTYGFTKRRTYRNETCYTKELDKSWEKEFFTADFYAEKDSHHFRILHLGTDVCQVVCT